MLEIDKTLVSLDVITSCFTCDLSACKGACCVTGDSGAPLEADEVRKLEEIYPALKPFLREEAVRSIEEQGTSVIDIESDTVTPLIEGKECAYTLFENGIARCAIEKAFMAGVIDFRKPVSCYLYPIRIKKYRQYDAVNYDRWEICQPAIRLGEEQQMPVYLFCKNALSQYYGSAWFSLLETAAKNLEITRDSDAL
ncbi:MAG: DUF3109 family protein [Bacteroidales bacterium]|nr:DUF3109 family protein [Bacteroidales bacterium]